MDNWFCSVFLPSIFDRCKDQGRKMWLSQKQTLVCLDNMELHQVRFDPDGYGVRCTHNNYACDWEGRRVILSYSKKNGCGLITFGLDESEIKAAQIEADLERQRIESERIERIKKNPERLSKRVAILAAKIDALRIQQATEINDPDYDEDDEKWYTEEIAKLETELARLMEVSV